MTPSADPDAGARQVIKVAALFGLGLLLLCGLAGSCLLLVSFFFQQG
jgi:hypothetical protein